MQNFRRLLAALLDAIVLSVIALVIVWLGLQTGLRETMTYFCIDTVFWDGILVLPCLLVWLYYLLADPQASISQSVVMMWSIFIILNWLYHALMESSAKQATIGKMLLKIRVSNLQGKKISFWQATIRHFSKILSTLILGIGYLMVFCTSKKQSLHDKIAGCVVQSK